MVGCVYKQQLDIYQLPFHNKYQYTSSMQSIRKKLLPKIITLLALVWQTYEFSRNSNVSLNSINEAEPKICDGNRFKHISTYALGRQNDLFLTFREMQSKTKVDKVVYKDQAFRTYTIFSLNLTLDYLEGSQISTIVGPDQVKVSGGILRISYTFDWQKKQLTSSITGKGKGAVKTDPISFIKNLTINNETKTLQWNYVAANPITITNSLTISEMSPYKATDYDVLNEMLNVLKSGDPTVKSKLVSALNANFTSILAKIVHENNDTWKQPQRIFYSYSDNHGSVTLTYDNVLINATLLKGLDITLSQTIQNDTKFECGDKVPTEPEDERKYGGLQQFISNTFLKSTLKNNLNRGNLDVTLTQQFWQSPAFQFYMGDVHEVIPSTKNISSLQPINGKCKAMDDKYFNLLKKTLTSYLVSVNFTCEFHILNNTKKLFSMNLAVDYEVEVRPLSSSVDFVVKSITGVPTIIQEDQYQFKKMDLAEYMISQTLKMALKSKVFGSGFKTLGGKYPGVEVRDKYLFLFDIGTKMAPTLTQQKLAQPKPRKLQRKSALIEQHIL